ncbi:MAG: bis(5'-nucleosyl)-tetraphosphatase (symmetrical) YqeK [Elusimicrobia bacterium]|nr:bis(5'-nucleosyl)-tetraphosphatase (symmetrical) YqeK [Elusimicrobiota bacterium]
MTSIRLSEKEARARLKAILSPGRWTHTLAVSRLAQELAARHGENTVKARWAGLLHDCAKEMPGRDLKSYVLRHRLRVPGKDFILDRRQYDLFHANVSAGRAMRDFGIRDRTILNAISRHTLGHPRMSRLDKILYVADFSALQRGFGPAKRIRRIARRDLEGAFREAVQRKILYILQAGSALHPQTVSLWNRLVR